MFWPAQDNYIEKEARTHKFIENINDTIPANKTTTNKMIYWQKIIRKFEKNMTPILYYYSVRGLNNLFHNNFKIW